MEEDIETVWLPLSLPGGGEKRLYVEIVPRGGREEVGLGSASLDRIAELITPIATSMGEMLEKVKPKKAAVELGFEFGFESGNLIALIARGDGKANLKIKLEWEHS